MSFTVAPRAVHVVPHAWLIVDLLICLVIQSFSHCCSTTYSVLKLLIGFAIAAFIAWKPIVTIAVTNTTAAAKTKAHTPTLILYAKSCNHLFIAHHVTGMEMK